MHNLHLYAIEVVTQPRLRIATRTQPRVRIQEHATKMASASVYNQRYAAPEMRAILAMRAISAMRNGRYAQSWLRNLGCVTMLIVYEWRIRT